MPAILKPKARPAEQSSEHKVRPTEKAALVQRIILTPAFRNSERLVALLQHVCKMEAAGRSDEINEQQIGVAVFERSGDYDPSIDGIVRSHASRLRLRLEQYFENEGREETVVLSIPRGGYVPIFELRPNPTLSAISPPEFSSPLRPPQPLLPQTRPASKLFDLRAGLILILVILIAIIGVTVRNTSLATRVMIQMGLGSPSDIFWRSMFVPGRITSLVTGDAGVNMFENMAKRQVSAEEYNDRTWLNDPLAQTPAGYTWTPLAARTYTPFFVVDFAVRLGRLPEATNRQIKVINARELNLNNLKNEQLLVIGGPSYNPWEQLISNRQNFNMVYDGAENSITIYNKQPRIGELPVYKWVQTRPASQTGYALISFSHNLGNSGRILMLQGSTAQGDAAATEYVLDREKIDPYLRQALTRDGGIKDFQLLLQTTFIAGGNIDYKVLGFRVYP